MSALTALSRLSPRRTAPDDLVEAVAFLEWNLDAETIAAAADGLGIALGAVGLVVSLVAGVPALTPVVLGVALGVASAARWTPSLLANARRARALGEAPGVVSLAVLQARISPTAEGAAAFAAQRDGVLGSSLARHVRAANGTPRSGIGDFAETWRETFPALHRAMLLVESATDAPQRERDRALDRAMDAVLDGTRDRTANAAESIRGPATALYAFGVLLPLALVGVLPAAGAAGVDATLLAVVVVYDLLLPFGLIAASAWILARRPVAFPPAIVSRDHPDVPARRWPVFVVAVGVAAGGWIAVGAVLSPWMQPLAALGLGVGVALVSLYRPIVSVRERVDTFERSLPDALYLIGRRVADGVAVERAVATAATELDEPARAVFTDAARRQRQLRIGIEAAFRGDHGVLSTVPSRRGESAAALFGVAARKGPPAGQALIETADHLDDLRRVERACKRDLGEVTSTLANTASVFAPLVGGATVALADSVGTTSELDGNVPTTAEIGLAVGVYVLLLAVVLTALSVGLSRGIDRATVGYRVGVALSLATTTYLVAFYTAVGIAGGL